MTFASIKKAQRVPTNRFAKTSSLLFFVKPGSQNLSHFLTKNEEFKSALTVNACTWLGAKMQKCRVHLHKWWLPGSFAKLVVTWFISTSGGYPVQIKLDSFNIVTARVPGTW